MYMTREEFNNWMDETTKLFGFSSMSLVENDGYNNALLEIVFSKPTTIAMSSFKVVLGGSSIMRYVHPNYPIDRQLIYVKMVEAFKDWLVNRYLGGISLTSLVEYHTDTEEKDNETR